MVRTRSKTLGKPTRRIDTPPLELLSPWSKLYSGRHQVEFRFRGTAVTVARCPIFRPHNSKTGLEKKSEAKEILQPITGQIKKMRPTNFCLISRKKRVTTGPATDINVLCAGKGVCDAP